MKTISKLILLSLFISFSACEKEGILSESAAPELTGAKDIEASETSVEDDIIGCETAFAYDKYATCFLDEPNLNSNRWGWSIGPLQAPLNMSYPIYQAAGQCDLDNGEIVGRLYVSYVNNIVTVDYVANDGFGFYQTHLYVGNTKYPIKRGRFTVAPGQYPYSHSFPDGVFDDNFKIDGVLGKIYIIAHAVVCPLEKKEDEVK